MRQEEISALIGAIGPVIREFTELKIAKAVSPLLERINELESKSLRDAGVWKDGVSYGCGAVVTDHGSAWVCKMPTAERPGESAMWRLLVKRGRDGKDATR